jgi:hypothetical protein
MTDTLKKPTKEIVKTPERAVADQEALAAFGHLMYGFTCDPEYMEKIQELTNPYYDRKDQFAVEGD